MGVVFLLHLIHHYNVHNRKQKTMTKFIYSLIFITIFFSSCKGQMDSSSSTQHKIEKIEYSTTRCFGTCPVFSLTINADKSAEWDAKMFNKINGEKISGKFHSKINKKEYNEIVILLNEMDFEKLENNYQIEYTDAQSSTLKITYDNGKTKAIQDYGLQGTEELKQLYKILFDLRENQKWK